MSKLKFSAAIYPVFIVTRSLRNQIILISLYNIQDKKLHY